MFSVRLKGYDWERFKRDILKAIDGGLKRAAEEAPLDVARRIERRLTPKNLPQKQNSIGTARQKRKSLGHDIPLRFTGTLGNPGKYPPPIRQGTTWVVRPPVGRVAVIKKVRERGYALFEMSAKLRRFAKRNILQRLVKLKGRMASYERSK